MSVTISKFKPTPQNVSVGNTNVVISFDGVVSALVDNPISITLFVEPGSSVFIVDQGANVTSITWQAQFTLAWATYNKQITFNAVLQPGNPTAVSLRLEAMDSAGIKSTKNSFLIIH